MSDSKNTEKEDKSSGFFGAFGDAAVAAFGIELFKGAAADKASDKAMGFIKSIFSNEDEILLRDVLVPQALKDEPKKREAFREIFEITTHKGFPNRPKFWGPNQITSHFTKAHGLATNDFDPAQEKIKKWVELYGERSPKGLHEIMRRMKDEDKMNGVVVPTIEKAREYIAELVLDEMRLEAGLRKVGAEEDVEVRASYAPLVIVCGMVAVICFCIFALKSITN